MILKHIALVCSTEENSDKFYENLLGLKKESSKILSDTLSKQIFNLDSECQIINYADEVIHFEIFIDAQKRSEGKKIEHVCLEVDKREMFLDQCHALGVKILRVPKGNGILIFVSDFDGNLFEIKEKEQKQNS